MDTYFFADLLPETNTSYPNADLKFYVLFDSDSRYMRYAKSHLNLSSFQEKFENVWMKEWASRWAKSVPAKSLWVPVFYSGDQNIQVNSTVSENCWELSGKISENCWELSGKIDTKQQPTFDEQTMARNYVKLRLEITIWSRVTQIVASTCTPTFAHDPDLHL